MTRQVSRWERSVDRLCERLREIAKGVESSEPYGVEGCHSLWCEKCAPKKAHNLSAGWAINQDVQEFCQKCGKILDHFFTDYGVECELGYSVEDTRPIAPDEAFTLLNCIDTGFPKLTCPCGDFVNRPDLKPMLRKIMKRLPKMLRKRGGQCKVN